MMMNQNTGHSPKVPSSRFNIDAHFHKDNDRPGSFNAKGGYFLNETLQEFDPGFFGMTPVEAMWMDPQQRKLLEVVYETFESAGVSLQEMSGSDTACFIATFTADFQQMSFKEHSFRHSLTATGVDPGIISNRISHIFNLRGPSIVVNTACSSSVYAIHNACNALRTKECSAAIVGGSNLVLTVDQHMNTAKLGVLSPDSICHTFNEHANGYGRAEGVGAVYLKRLSDAIRDGNPVRGVIRASAANSNGKVAGVGITHPSYAGQCAVIRHAYHRGGPFDPAWTGYFECHGTGTPVGDPLEVRAVADSMNDLRERTTHPLLIGAVKTNIGHSEAASGLSAVIKAILAVERGIIPPTRGVTDLNSKIDWDGWKVKVPTEPTPFYSYLPVRRVSVNSFGYGGTNAHIIVEGADSLLVAPQRYQYTATQPKARLQITRGTLERNRPFLVPFSAHDKPTLKRNIEAHSTVVQNYNLLDLSYTLANCRTRFQSRAFAVATSPRKADVFADDLQQFTFSERKKSHALGFVFTGQGAQWARMGAELMTYYPSFLQSIRYMDAILEGLDDTPEWTLEDTLLEDANISVVNEAEFSQPLGTAIQVALVQLLRLWNIVPSITCGHSSGEIAAAYAAGFISAAEAIVLAYYRGKVVRDISTNGAMMAVGLGAKAVQPYIVECSTSVVVACYNSPAGVTLSGDADALEAIREKMTADNVFARILKTGDKAYHSPHMQPAAAKYEALVRNARQTLDLDSPKLLSDNVQMVSSVTNTILARNAVLDESYWSANLLSPVLFSQVIQTIASSAEFDQIDTLIEVGPHSALSGPIRQIKAEFNLETLQYLPTLTRNENSATSLLKLAGELFLHDYPLDLQRVTAIEESLPSSKIFCKKGSLIVDLPPYQWDKTKRFLAECRESREHRQAKHIRHDILGSIVPGCDLTEPSWRNLFRIRDLPWLKDHSIGGEAIFPAAGYFSMAMEAITQLRERADSASSIEGYVLRDVSIKQALVTPDDDFGIEVMLSMRPSLYAPNEDQSPWWDFNISSITESGYVKEHVAGSISVTTRRKGLSSRAIPNFPQRASGKSWNQALREVGFYYGPAFQDIENIYFDGKTYAAACDTRLKTTVEGMIEESRHVLHPGTVDSCLQLLLVANWAGRARNMTAGSLPIQVNDMTIWKPTAAQIDAGAATALSWIDLRGLRAFNGQSELKAKDGEVLMEIRNMRWVAYEAVVPQKAGEPEMPQPYGEMVWKIDVDSLYKSAHLDVSSFVNLVLFKDPESKVMVVGAETAEAVLTKLQGCAITVMDSVSELSQSMKDESFDLVVASINTSKDLMGVRKLLTPGGRAIITPETLLDPNDYATSGFSHDIITLRDGTGVVASAVNSPLTRLDYMNGSDPHAIHLVYRHSPPAIMSDIQSALEQKGCLVSSSSIVSHIEMGSNVILLADFEEPLLHSITESEFIGLQRITNTATRLLWVTAGGLLEGKKPEYAMASGLIRSLMSEQASLRVTLVDFDTETTSSEDICRILTARIVQQDKGIKPTESEYYVSKGQTFISRLLSNEIINTVYLADETKPKSMIFDPNLPIVGKLQSGKVIFEMDDSIDDSLASESVEVRVLTTGLNKEDAIIASGADVLTDFSHEIGGVVTRVGNATTGYAPGDRVIGFSFGKFATIQRAHQSLLHKVQPSESLPEMTSLPMVYGTALYGLKTLAHLQESETVLILPGSGLAGSAAIGISKAFGGYPYVVATSAAEAEFISSHFELDSCQVILASEVSKLRDVNGQYKVDVIFASEWVAPSVAREVWRHIAPFARFVNCGRKDVLTRSILDTVPLRRGAQYISYDLLDLHNIKPHIMSQLLGETVSLYRQGIIAALFPRSLKNIAGLDSALASFSDGFEAGKTIILHETSEATLNILPPRPRLTLRADATYLLIGCLGGLGRSLTSWLMKKGARNFAFLSRSGANSEQASLVVDELKAAGATVQIFRGDAGVKSDVEEVVNSISGDRPIRGVINAAMVLRVSHSFDCVTNAADITDMPTHRMDCSTTCRMRTGQQPYIQRSPARRTCTRSFPIFHWISS
jgi:acyl transferase domain-containing protein/NADPH:quinone reductase-like Zn-dependent oxidoreductase